MKVGVVGLGLIGGSIFKSLKSLGYDIVGVSQSQGTDDGGKEHIYKDKSILSDCEIVFVCCNMNKVLDELNDLQQYLNPETIVCDVCSLKEFVSNGKYSYRFVPTHPMAGTEFSGYENSFEGLFKGAKWIVTDENVPNNLKQIIKDLGAKLVIMTAKEHDMAVALISHMPLVLSQALFKTIEDSPDAQLLASSGFRDMTRLALSNEQMACDMVSLNSENIQQAFLKLYSSIGDLIKENYPDKIHKIKEQREKMYKDGVNVV